MNQPLISATIDAIIGSLGSLNGQDTFCVYAVLFILLLVVAGCFAKLTMSSRG